MEPSGSTSRTTPFGRMFQVRLELHNGQLSPLGFRRGPLGAGPRRGPHLAVCSRLLPEGTQVGDVAQHFPPNAIALGSRQGASCLPWRDRPAPATPPTNGCSRTVEWWRISSACSAGSGWRTWPLSGLSASRRNTSRTICASGLRTCRGGHRSRMVAAARPAPACCSTLSSNHDQTRGWWNACWRMWPCCGATFVTPAGCRHRLANWWCICRWWCTPVGRRGMRRCGWCRPLGCHRNWPAFSRTSPIG